jgi:hypothetical protein
MKAQFGSLAVKLDAWQRDMQVEREARKSTDLKANPEEMESEEEHREVAKDRAVEAGKAPSKRHRNRHLAAGRRGNPKELVRGDCGSRRKLTVACRKVSYPIRVTWCKRNIIRN